MTIKNKTTSFAEIIESSLVSWTAQSWNWKDAPQFGSLLIAQTEKNILVGLVYHVTTGALENGRYPFTYQKTEEELQEEQPQIFEFLKTTFSCITIGTYNNNLFKSALISPPARIHNFVDHPPLSIYQTVLDQPAFLSLLYNNAHNFVFDELVIAFIQNCRQKATLEETTLEHFCDYVARLIGYDYQRLTLFLQRISS